MRQTVAAVRWVKQRNLCLVSSVGLQTWELITALASIERIPLELCVPVPNKADFASLCGSLTDQFGLDPGLVSFVPVTGDISDREKRLLLSRRDRLMVQTADIVVPISVRLHGNMAELLAWAQESGKQVVRDFEITPEKHTEAMKYSLEGASINPAVMHGRDSLIIHWTRGTNAAWPGERLIDLYRDVLSSSDWPRNGFATLRRIADSGMLRASPRHMPGHTPCVCFSALPPVDVVPLMRWRARYAEMSFEPYGMGLHQDLAESLGIVPVHYCESPKDATCKDLEPWQCQSIGEVTDWRAEREYRCKGDLRIDGIPRDAVTLFCRTAAEACELRQACRYEVIPLFA